MSRLARPWRERLSRRAGPGPRARALRTVRLLGVAAGTAALAAVLGLGVFPTRTWLDQRAATGEAERRIAALRERSAALEERIEQLETDAEIERIAREQHNLLMPGERAFVVLPPPSPPPPQIPPLWPFGPLLEPPAPR